MSSQRGFTGAGRSAALAVVSVLAALLLHPATAAASGSSAEVDPTTALSPGIYLVTLRQPPSATYQGSDPRFAATAPHGKRFNAHRPAVRAYRTYLEGLQQTVLVEVNGGEPMYSYTTALNGFAADLSTEQVKQLRSLPGVLSVERSTKAKVDTDNTPRFLGLSGANGVSRGIGGPARAGAGVVIGVVDSGVWPENPSFADVPIDPQVLRAGFPGFTGGCEPGERWQARTCNSKIIAARYFLKGFGSQNLSSAEYASARDGTGHGSHTASTAAGNNGVDVTIGGQDFGLASGLAPGARLAIYKACWSAPDPADDGCTTADTVMAIDQAVADGVDVLNYSISGSRSSVTDAVETAFLNAASAGVFVATSAGNSGPSAGTVAHASPWVTTVAATTHLLYQGSIRLGDGEVFVGAMVSDRLVKTRPIVYARDVAAAGHTPDQAAECQPGSIRASAVANAIVVCDRGGNARIEKSATVDLAGGAGMVLANRLHGTVDADFHSVPTIHVSRLAAVAIKAYIAAKPSSAVATIDPNGADGTKVPQVADFSSRGPSAAGSFLKPDLSAPGVSVLSAVAPPSNLGRLWDLYSGTSMAAPHVAGLAALIQGAHPSWSPADIKSAMATTAQQVVGDARPFAVGAGNVNPADFLDPGLVFPAGSSDWLSFRAGKLEASQLNSASVAVESLVGPQTVVRTVTNVSNQRETYNASRVGVRGIQVTVSPASFTVSPGASQTIRITFEATSKASYGRYAVGQLILTGSQGHVVHSAVAVAPRLVDAPAEATGSGTSGSTSINATSGVTGSLPLSGVGLVGATPDDLALTPGGFDPDHPAEGQATSLRSYDVPTGTTAIRFDVTTVSADTDLDLFVYRNNDLVALSAGNAGDERVTLDNPEPGRYDVYVNAASATTDQAGGTFTGWVLPADSAAALTLPSLVSVTGGLGIAITPHWSGLDPDQRYWGYVEYPGSGRRTALTVN